MKAWVAGILMLLPLAVAASGEYTLSADDWARPRDGAALVKMAPLAEAVRELARRPGSDLVIGYPGGEDGTVWAQELRGWLVALGVPSRRIELLPASALPGTIDLSVRPHQ